MANQVGDVGDLAPCSLEREIPEKTHKMLVFKDQPPSQTQVTSGPGIRRSHPFAPGAATDSALASKRGRKMWKKTTKCCDAFFSSSMSREVQNLC